MAKRGTPLGFSYIPSKVEGYFAFISGATTVSGLFLGLFGLTAFGYMLTGDGTINMYNVLKSLSVLPNPLEFIRDCTSLTVAMSNVLSKMDFSFSGYVNNAVLDAIIGIFKSILTLIVYVGTFFISALLLPFYLIWFVLRCGAVAFTSIGLSSYVPPILTQDWQPVSWLLGILGGI